MAIKKTLIPSQGRGKYKNPYQSGLSGVSATMSATGGSGGQQQGGSVINNITNVYNGSGMRYDYADTGYTSSEIGENMYKGNIPFTVIGDEYLFAVNDNHQERKTLFAAPRKDGSIIWAEYQEGISWTSGVTQGGGGSSNVIVLDEEDLEYWEDLIDVLNSYDIVIFDRGTNDGMYQYIKNEGGQSRIFFGPDKNKMKWLECTEGQLQGSKHLLDMRYGETAFGGGGGSYTGGDNISISGNVIDTKSALNGINSIKADNESEFSIETEDGDGNKYYVRFSTDGELYYEDSEGNYKFYTDEQFVQDALGEKQDVLTAGSGITIQQVAGQTIISSTSTGGGNVTDDWGSPAPSSAATPLVRYSTTARHITKCNQVGSNSTPMYIDSDGMAVPCGFSLIRLTQAQYDAITIKGETTLYVIIG